MFKVYKKEIEVAGKKISLETGKVARQADGAIIASCGETVILATVVGAKKVNPDMDYFPLSVNYQEKYYAGGKIPGGFFKREARPTESEQLISRLIDRPIRPLFPSEFKNEVQLLPTVISYDKENQPDILAITASSAALAISGMPFMGPVGASRVGYVDGKYILNPSKAELENSTLARNPTPTHTHTHTHTHEDQEVCSCMFVCVSGCVCMRMCVCVCACTREWVCVCACAS